MKHIDPDVLVPLVFRFVEREGLNLGERAEVLRLAQGYACKESAAEANLATETIRARRKGIYRKLRVKRAGGVVAGLLDLALELLATGVKLEPLALVEGEPPRLAGAGSAPQGVLRVVR